MLIVVSLFGLFVGVVYEVVLIGLRSVNAADEREGIRQQLVSSLERFVRDASTASNVDAARGDRFQFDTPSLIDVDYTYDSANDTLSRDDGASASQVILRTLTAFDFNYLDTNGTQLGEPVPGNAEDTIRVVQVTATATQDGETITVSNAAFLRNIQ